jgi:hypothetical protein
MPTVSSPRLEREHQVPLLRHERAGYAYQTGNGTHRGLRRTVDDVERIVGGVRHVETLATAVHPSVVEAPRFGVRGKVDVPEEFEHGDLGAADAYRW